MCGHMDAFNIGMGTLVHMRDDISSSQHKRDTCEQREHGLIDKVACERREHGKVTSEHKKRGTRINDCIRTRIHTHYVY